MAGSFLPIQNWSLCTIPLVESKQFRQQQNHSISFPVADEVLRATPDCGTYPGLQCRQRLALEKIFLVRFHNLVRLETRYLHITRDVLQGDGINRSAGKHILQICPHLSASEIMPGVFLLLLSAFICSSERPSAITSWRTSHGSACTCAL